MSAANRNGDEIWIRKALWSTANGNEEGTGIRKARMSTADRNEDGIRDPDNGSISYTL